VPNHKLYKHPFGGSVDHVSTINVTEYILVFSTVFKY